MSVIGTLITSYDLTMSSAIWNWISHQICCLQNILGCDMLLRERCLMRKNESENLAGLSLYLGVLFPSLVKSSIIKDTVTPIYMNTLDNQYFQLHCTIKSKQDPTSSEKNNPHCFKRNQQYPHCSPFKKPCNSTLW